MRRTFWTLILVVFVLGGCSGGAPSSAGTQNPTNQATTSTPSATPAPQAVINAEKAVLYAGPDNLLFESLGELPHGAMVEPLGIFGDFLYARAEAGGKRLEGYLYAGSVDLLRENLPQMDAKDVPTLRENALAWNGWAFKQSGMSAEIDNGILTASSTSGWMTLFNYKHPIQLDQALAIQVQVKGEGWQTDINLAGRFSADNDPWWKGIRRLNITFHVGDPNGKPTVSYYDGTKDSTVESCDLKPLPADGIFILSFWEVDGLRFTITDQAGNSLLSGTTFCTLPSELFPDKVAYLGYNVAADSKLQIAQYEILTLASGKFVNFAVTKQAAPVYLAESGLLRGGVVELEAGEKVRLLGASGELAWVEWTDATGKLRQGMLELAVLDKILVLPQATLAEIPWQPVENGLLMDLWAGSRVLEINLLQVEGGLEGREVLSNSGLPWTQASGLEMKVSASGARAGIALVDTAAPESTLFTLWVEDGSALLLETGGQIVKAGALPQDGRLVVRVAQGSLNLLNGQGSLLASINVPGAAAVNNIRLKLIAGAKSRLLVSELVLLQAPSTAYAEFAQTGAGAFSRSLPVISAQNATHLSRVDQLDLGSPFSAVFSPDGKLLKVATLRGVVTYDTGTFEQLGASEFNYSDLDFYFTRVFSPDGNYLAEGRSGQIQIWDLRSGQVWASIPIGDYNLTLKFSADGKVLGIKAYESLLTYDMATNQLSQPIQLSEFAEGFDISPDGGRMVSAYTYRVLVYNKSGLERTIEYPLDNVPRSGNPSLPAGYGEIDWVGFSSDGSMIYAQLQRIGVMARWDAATGKLLDEWNIGNHKAFWLSPDNQFLLAAGYDGILRIYKFVDMQHPQDWGQVGLVSKIVSDGGGFFALVSDNGSLQYFDLALSKTPHVWQLSGGFGASAGAVLLRSQDGSRMLVVDISGYWGSSMNLAMWQLGPTPGFLASASQNKTRDTYRHKPSTIALSGDGRQVYYVIDRQILVWKPDINETSTFYEIPQGAIHAIALAPDEQTLWVSTAEGDVYDPASVSNICILILDIESKQVSKTLKDISSVVMFLAFSPDGARLAGGGADGKISLWNLKTWGVDQEWELGINMDANPATDPPMEYQTLVFSPDGKMLGVIAGNDPMYNHNQVQMWDTEQGKLLWLKQGKYKALTFSASGDLLAATNMVPDLWGNSRNELFLLNPSDGTVLYTVSRPLDLDANPSGVVFTGDGSALISAVEGGRIDVMAVVERQSASRLVRTFRGGEKPVFSSDGSLLATTPWKILIYNVKDGSLLRSHEGFSDIAFSEDGASYIIGNPATMQTLSVETGKQILPALVIGETCTNILAQNATKLACRQFLVSRLAIFDLVRNSKRMLTDPLQNQGWSSYEFGFSPDGSLVAVKWGAVLHIFDTSSGSETSRLPLVMLEMTKLALSADNQLLAAVGGHQVQVWNLADQSLAATYTWEPGILLAIAFSPDGKWLATGSADSTVQLWRLADGQLADVISGESASVAYLAFAPDSLSLAVSSRDDQTRLYDISGVK